MGKVDELIDEIVQELLVEHKSEIAQTLRDLADEIEGESVKPKRGPNVGSKGKKRTPQTDDEKKQKVRDYQRARYKRLKDEEAAGKTTPSKSDKKKCPSCSRPKAEIDDYCIKCTELA